MMRRKADSDASLPRNAGEVNRQELMLSYHNRKVVNNIAMLALFTDD